MHAYSYLSPQLCARYFFELLLKFSTHLDCQKHLYNKKGCKKVATTRDGVTRKRCAKRLTHKGNVFRNNL